MSNLFDKIKATWNFWSNYNPIIAKMKATWNFWNNYSKIKNILAEFEVPNYVNDLDDINQSVGELGAVNFANQEDIDVGKTIDTIHSMKQSSRFDINIPAHAPRKDSSLYTATRKHLIDELDTPCWVCGSKENRQAHHFIVEMAFSNCIDWSKVQKDYPDFPNWHLIDQNNSDTFFNFYDSEYNMRILCQSHHVGTGKTDNKYGIHYLPYPIFLIEKYVKDDFKLFND
jgi:hypothetical protein